MGDSRLGDSRHARGKRAIGENEAHDIAIAALKSLAVDEDRMNRFTALTGVATDDMRQAAGEPGFLLAVLDFYLGHEPDLIAFAEAANIDPERVILARRLLAGPGEEW